MTWSVCEARSGLSDSSVSVSCRPLPPALSHAPRQGEQSQSPRGPSCLPDHFRVQSGEPHMLRMSCLFSASRKQREGIPFTEGRETENCLASDSQNLRQHPRWMHLPITPASLSSLVYPRLSLEELAAAADLPRLMKAA